MATDQSDNSEEGAFIRLVNFDRDSSPSIASRISLETRRDTSLSTTLTRHRTLSLVRNSSDDAPQVHATGTSKRASAVSPVALAAANAHQLRDNLPNIIHDVWIKEILSMALSICCVIAVTVILACQNNTPLSSWPLPWQPSSVVSLLTTIARAALIFPLASCISQSKWHHFRQKPRPLADLQYFDAASRGPLGSLVFVCQVTCRSRSVLASLCCIFVVAALAMETLVQQTIDYPLRPILMDGKSCTAKVSNFLSFGTDAEETIAWNKHMIKAINTGIFEQTTFQTLTCPNGNCTWSHLTTLGLCSSCEDVTSTSKQDCDVTSHPDSEGSPYYTNCSYTTPRGATIGGHDERRSNDDPGQHWITSLDVKFFQNNSSHLSVAIVKNPIQRKSMDFVELKPLGVFECTLRLCSRVFVNTTIASGVVRKRDSTQHSLEMHLDNETISMHSRHDDDGRDAVQYKAVQDDAWVLLEAMGKNLFNLPLNRPGIPGDGKSASWFMHYAGYIYESDDIYRIFDDLADAMTEFLRTVNPVEIPGDCPRYITFVQVHWPWLIGPLLIELSAAVLLACCIAISARQKRRAGTQIWKDSVFPFLFNGIGREKLDEWVEMDELHEVARGRWDKDCASHMEARARRVRLRLQREGEEGEEGDGEGRLRFV